MKSVDLYLFRGALCWDFVTAGISQDIRQLIHLQLAVDRDLFQSFTTRAVLRRAIVGVTYEAD